MRYLLPLLAEKFVKTPKHGGFFEKLKVLAKSTIFRVCLRNEALFATFGWKVGKNVGTRWFLRKGSNFGQIDDFGCFLTKWGSFCHFWLKSSSKRRNTVISSKSCKFWPNRRFFPFFREMRDSLPLLAEKFIKTPKHSGLFEKLEVLDKSTIFRVFFTKWGIFCVFCLKSSSKRRNMALSSKTWKFWQNWRFFVVSREMRHLLSLLDEKFVKTLKHGAFFEKLQV